MPLKSLNSVPMSVLFCFDQNLFLGLRTKERGKNLLLPVHCGQPRSSTPPFRSVGSADPLQTPFSSPSSCPFWLTMPQPAVLQIPDTGEEVKSAVGYAAWGRWTPGAPLQLLQAGSPAPCSPGPSSSPWTQGATFWRWHGLLWWETWLQGCSR